MDVRNWLQVRPIAIYPMYLNTHYNLYLSVASIVVHKGTRLKRFPVEYDDLANYSECKYTAVDLIQIYV